LSILRSCLFVSRFVLAAIHAMYSACHRFDSHSVCSDSSLLASWKSASGSRFTLILQVEVWAKDVLGVTGVKSLWPPEYWSGLVSRSCSFAKSTMVRGEPSGEGEDEIGSSDGRF
jgi:hypothetical protein